MSIQTTIVNTNTYYHEIITAPDADTRHRLYLEHFVQPWAQMLSMFAQGGGDDELAGARAWNWLLPDDLTTVPESLRQLEDANAWEVASDALAKGAARFDDYADKMPLDTVTGWIALADPAKSDPVMRGYTGGVDFMQPRFIAQYDTPNDYNLSRLPGMVVHEMHHLIRLRLFPWDMSKTTIGDYIIHEGLAESFAAACFGENIVGYYVTDFDEGELQTARHLLRDGIEKTGFDILRAYIFGDYWAEKMHLPAVGMPTYGGYAMGYRVVQAYLERTGSTVVEATFVPAGQIIKESGYLG